MSGSVPNRRRPLERVPCGQLQAGVRVTSSFTITIQQPRSLDSRITSRYLVNINDIAVITVFLPYPHPVELGGDRFAVEMHRYWHKGSRTRSFRASAHKSCSSSWRRLIFYGNLLPQRYDRQHCLKMPFLQRRKSRFGRSVPDKTTPARHPFQGNVPELKTSRQKHHRRPIGDMVSTVILAQGRPRETMLPHSQIICRFF
jgi:hypothetical protein